jgi:uncharacterized protein YndB with AHSA1/START domain
VGYELRVERLFDAPPETVFDAFLDRRAQFGGEWGAIIESDLDLRVGGTWTVVYGWRGAEPDRESSVFSDVDYPRRLVYRQSIFSGEWGRSVDSTMTVTFQERNGKTLFTMLQTGFETEEVRDAFKDHVPGVLEGLQRAVAARTGDHGER